MLPQVGYEPYIMLHRDYTPFYDERFRGYYWCAGWRCLLLDSGCCRTVAAALLDSGCRLPLATWRHQAGW